MEIHLPRLEQKKEEQKSASLLLRNVTPWRGGGGVYCATEEKGINERRRKGRKGSFPSKPLHRKPFTSNLCGRGKLEKGEQKRRPRPPITFAGEALKEWAPVLSGRGWGETTENRKRIMTNYRRREARVILGKERKPTLERKENSSAPFLRIDLGEERSKCVEEGKN